MRDAAGGSYPVALKRTFVPELLSMNLLMAGMVPTAMALRRRVDLAGDPAHARFWFVMSMALLVGFIVAYPMNWWLVANHLKHGMMTVRSKKETAASAMSMGDHGGMAMGGARDVRYGDARGGQTFAVGRDDDRFCPSSPSRRGLPSLSRPSAMRIVGGRLKGRVLKAPSSRVIRPTSERLREFDLRHSRAPLPRPYRRRARG